MGKEKAASYFSGAYRMLKNIFYSFLKLLYLIPFFLIGLWLISVVYIPGFELKKSIPVLKFGKDRPAAQPTAQKKEEVPRDHFHMIDAYVEQGDAQPSICGSCHGTYAHGKEKTVRALLNMHIGFLDCSVCHVRKDKVVGIEGALLPKNERIDFLWVDRETGGFKNAAEGEYGKYAAKIFPVIFDDQKPLRIYKPIAEQDARRFLEIQPTSTTQQLDEARIKLHEGISKEPVSCSDCHKKNGYLDFIKLGFPQRRVDHIVASEFVGMIDKYKTFYLPSVIDFRAK
jgi:hypothetical protein